MSLSKLMIEDLSDKNLYYLICPAAAKDMEVVFTVDSITNRFRPTQDVVVTMGRRVHP
jgi:hypothetical protein